MYYGSMSELFHDHGWRVVLESATLPDGRVQRAARVGRADSVHILAFPTESTILMLREYRPYYGTSIWMLPSGRVDKESDSMIAAQRELQEETGFKANELTLYCTTNNSESLMMTSHYFIARRLVPSVLPQDDDEMIEVHTLKLEEALQNVLSSKKVHTASAFALLRYMKEHPLA